MTRQYVYRLFIISSLLLSGCKDGSIYTGNANIGNNGRGFFTDFFSSTKDRAIESLSPHEYIRYCENEKSGLKENKTMGDFVFSGFFQPLNYLAIKECKNNDTLTKKLFNQKLDEYGDMTYFSFKIQNTKQQVEFMKINLRSERDYYARLEYLSFQMQQDFKLIQGKDTLDCALYHFERIYGLAPYATFVLAFPNIKIKEDVKILYYDRLFNTGIVILNFEKDNLIDLPKLDV